MLNIVYVRVKRPHYKEEACFACSDEHQALALCKYLNYLGVEGAQRLDQEMYDAIPDAILDDY